MIYISPYGIHQLVKSVPEMTLKLICIAFIHKISFNLITVNQDSFLHQHHKGIFITARTGHGE